MPGGCCCCVLTPAPLSLPTRLPPGGCVGGRRAVARVPPSRTRALACASPHNRLRGGAPRRRARACAGATLARFGLLLLPRAGHAAGSHPRDLCPTPVACRAATHNKLPPLPPPPHVYTVCSVCCVMLAGGGLANGSVVLAAAGGGPSPPSPHSAAPASKVSTQAPPRPPPPPPPPRPLPPSLLPPPVETPPHPTILFCCCATGGGSVPGYSSSSGQIANWTPVSHSTE